MYMLLLAKSASEVIKTIVGMVLTKSSSAVPNITIKLVSCSDISIFAFMSLDFFIMVIYSVI